MKTKLIRRLIQFAAIVYLIAAIVFMIWKTVQGGKGLDVDDLFVLGTIVAIIVAYWGINVKFPQPEVRCRIYGKLMLVFIILTLCTAVLCIIKSTTDWAASLFMPVALCLVSSYSQREESLRQSSKNTKRSL